MFKVSLLQATSGKQQQTAAGATGKQRASQQSTAPQQQGSSLSALEPRDWSLQAATVTEGLLDASKYKSLAVYAEVKLAEALDKAAKTLPDACDEDGQLLPNTLKTAVCCQLLGELAELCGPFSGTLLKLRDELLPAVYSTYAAAQTNRPLQFDQMPWFVVANQLQEQNQALLFQQEAFKAELNKHQEQMGAVEQQLLAFKATMDAGEASAAELQATNAGLVAARDAAVEEAAAAAEELKRLAAQIVNLKDELVEMQEQLNNAKEVASQDVEQWQGQLEAFKKQLHIEKQEREAAVALAAARLTVAEGQELEQRCQEAERKLEEAEQKLAAVAAANKTGAVQELLFTPRPTEWGEAQELANKCKATSETVRQLLQQHNATLTSMQRRLRLLQALALPEPAPRPLELSLRTETSTYFITEGALNLDEEQTNLSKPKLFAVALGFGPDVPAFLRWDEAVELQDTSLAKLQQQISSIWQGKAEFEALHGPCHLQTYLHHHFTKAAGEAGVASDAGAQVCATDAAVDAKGVSSAAAASCSSTNGASLEISLTGGIDAKVQEANKSVEEFQAAAAAGYQLYHALSTYKQESASAATMWCVLTGQLPEAVVQEQQQQLQGLLQVLQQLADAGSEGTTEGSTHTGGLAVAQVPTVLRLLHPLKQQQDLAAIAACLEAACSSINISNVIKPHVAATIVAGIRQQAGVVLGMPCFSMLPHEMVHSSAGCAGSFRNSAAATSSALQAVVNELLECLLQQYLQDCLSHTQETVQRVQQLLTAGSIDPAGAPVEAAAAQPVPTASGSNHHTTPVWDVAVWQQVSAVLLQQPESRGSTAGGGSRGTTYSHRTSSAMRKEAAGGPVDGLARRLGYSTSGRYGSGTQELSLVAAAAANKTSDAGSAVATVASSAAHSMPVTTSSVSSLSSWLSAAQLVQPGKLEVQQLLLWLQRKCLLTPASCRQDVGAALQWCRSACQSKAASGGAEPSASGTPNVDGTADDGLRDSKESWQGAKADE